MPQFDPNTTKKKNDANTTISSKENGNDPAINKFDALMRDYATHTVAEDSKVKPLDESAIEQVFKACKEATVD